MRANWRWLHTVAIAGLILGVLPLSALAALCQPVRCSMPCCEHADPIAKAQQTKDAACPDHRVASAAGTAKNHAARREPAKASPCNCSIKSKGDQETERNLPATTAGFKTPDVAAVFVPISTELGLPEQVMILPGVFASDSGPPEGLASLPWLGRAPPVFA
ncbi:MAG: hypothetical protein JSS66_08660 [Armatimonadetes bacterium]|nr:hypothetical protein [Armatimonadota bacterium]